MTYDPPTRIPTVNGDEVDALDHRWKSYYHWRAGARKAAKRSYNRRLRRLARYQP